VNVDEMAISKKIGRVMENHSQLDVENIVEMFSLDNKNISLDCLVFQVVWRVDYRCEDDRFSVSVTCVTTSNPDSLPSSDTGECCNKKLEEALIWCVVCARCQKAAHGIQFTEK
jgi:hypothetical protein